ncbi:multidrug effflux MFS transporter [Prescottella equi]|uniref:multidrug effflux MFS transporter n=1 Tax=Rhodococcus hoagii TaxID=43767 RepID=UPI000A11B9B4|nr:multidrug effflux MFS transporter [Prescottella equi]NKR74294.1 Bcr/CflA family efflux MFS transporter [Prescottella equi]NKS18981.1 Bcr/CflA family efflux MFS transporter [Prescottella equi]NKS20255.1 Bcr/CflA family efflux MFS transporter [Prescottella equi]NKS67041.1 Bcr/CflA family efflux MFS transporter [Prescottella equi]ORJ98808.1 Bcr/CflA family drug resistance efflux transporter [Prescottella equi]
MTADATTDAVREGARVAAPEGWSRIRLVVILGLLTALGPFTVDMYLPALPAITEDFLTSDAAVQLTLTGTLLGLALGQLVIGPLSDVFGRRRPLVLGTSLHVAASVACWFAPSIAVLGALRALQGLGAAATGVIAMAVVRDLFEGRDAAVVMSRLMLVMGVAPILAPSIGGVLLTAVSWHGVFLVLAGLGLVMIVLGGVAMPETLPTSARVGRGLGPVLRTYATVARDGHFMVLVLVCGLGRAVLWAYIAGSSFVMQDQFELAPGVYGIAFAAGAVVLIGASQLNVVLLGRWTPLGICVTSLAASTVLGGVAIGLAATATGGFLGFALPVLALLCATGFVMPNAPALALSRHGEAAGTAAAMVGFAQFGAAAVIAPIVGLLGNTSLAIAVAMTGSAVLALLALGTVVRPSARSRAALD